MVQTEFLLRAELTATTLEVWIAEGWISPEPAATEAELARAALIRELTEGLGVNAEGVGVALALIDQIHGLRRALKEIGGALDTLPSPLREATLAALRRTE